MDFEREELSNEDTKNFKYLDDLIHSGVKEIVLDSDIVLYDDESDSLDGIKLDVDDLVICGNGHTIDVGERRIFYCTGKNITIKNIILSGAVNFYGGAIYNEGELTITESTLERNTALEEGGAIYNKGKLTITKSTLEENSATYNDGGYYHGGAIYNEGELTITESTLNYNLATGDGGAIYNEGELTITESTLNENRAKYYSSSGLGGAIYNNDAECTISNSTFDGYIEGVDEAIYNNGSECTISNSTFDGEKIQRLKLFKDGLTVNDEDVGNSSLLEHRHDNFDEEYEDIQKELERLRLGK